jgi:hypothetical protein
MLSRFRLFALPLISFLPVLTIAEQPPRFEGPRIPKLHFLAQKAGYIFSGTVKSIDRIVPSATNGAPVMRIAFHVDKAFLGVRDGQALVIHEWVGLWQSGESYRPGEKVLLFLYPPSKLGLTSPVGGMSGRFSVDPGGRIIIDPGRVIRPTRPSPRTGHPKTILLSPEDFARALRSAWSEQ